MKTYQYQWILTPSDILSMKYPHYPRSTLNAFFCRYKSILKPNRRKFKFENLQMYIL